MKISKDTDNSNRMKTYEAVVTTRTRIIGRNEEEAKEALKEWLTNYEQDRWELQSFYLIEDPAW